jgi:hypothetical protein
MVELTRNLSKISLALAVARGSFILELLDFNNLDDGNASFSMTI